MTAASRIEASDLPRLWNPPADPEPLSLAEAHRAALAPGLAVRRRALRCRHRLEPGRQAPTPPRHPSPLLPRSILRRLRFRGPPPPPRRPDHRARTGRALRRHRLWPRHPDRPRHPGRRGPSGTFLTYIAFLGPRVPLLLPFSKS